MRTRGWHGADSFAAAGRLAAIADAAAPGIRLRRFESDSGEQALLVPAKALGADLDAAVTDILFVDPPTAESALSLAAEIGDLPHGLRVALPAGADPAGLVADGGGIRVRRPEPVDQTLYRLADPRVPTWERDRGAGRLGETEGNLDARERWFESREGGG